MCKMAKSKDGKNVKKFYMPIPPGVPLSILSETAQKYKLAIGEREITVPSAEGILENPRTLVLTGNRESLIKAKGHIRRRLEKRLKKLEIPDK